LKGVLVRSQEDSEQAALNLERTEFASDDLGERRELTAIYVSRGLDTALAKEVAKQLMAHDALGAHGMNSISAGCISECSILRSRESQSRRPRSASSRAPTDPDLDTLHAVIMNRYDVLVRFATSLQRTFAKEHDVLRRTAPRDARALRDVERCATTGGGLPPGFAEQLLLPFVQAGPDKSGLGRGLSICRRAVDANNGLLSVRDIQGSGCILTICLPRHRLPTPDLPA
jgi:hypothetical protein